MRSETSLPAHQSAVDMAATSPFDRVVDARPDFREPLLAGLRFQRDDIGERPSDIDADLPVCGPLGLRAGLSFLRSATAPGISKIVDNRRGGRVNGSFCPDGPAIIQYRDDMPMFVPIFGCPGRRSKLKIVER